MPLFETNDNEAIHSPTPRYGAKTPHWGDTTQWQRSYLRDLESGMYLPAIYQLQSAYENTKGDLILFTFVVWYGEHRCSFQILNPAWADEHFDLSRQYIQLEQIWNQPWQNKKSSLRRQEIQPEYIRKYSTSRKLIQPEPASLFPTWGVLYCSFKAVPVERIILNFRQIRNWSQEDKKSIRDEKSIPGRKEIQHDHIRNPAWASTPVSNLLLRICVLYCTCPHDSDVRKRNCSICGRYLDRDWRYERHGRSGGGGTWGGGVLVLALPRGCLAAQCSKIKGLLRVKCYTPRDTSQNLMKTTAVFVFLCFSFSCSFLFSSFIPTTR